MEIMEYQEKVVAFDLLRNGLGENNLAQLLKTALQELELRRERKAKVRFHQDYGR